MSSATNSSSSSNPGPIALSSSVDEEEEQREHEEEHGVTSRRRPRNQPWLFRDEVLILTTLAKHTRLGRRWVWSSAIINDIRGNLLRQNPTAADLSRKTTNLKEKFKRAIQAGGPGEGKRDRRLYELSVQVWPELLKQSHLRNSSMSPHFKNSKA